MITRRLKAIALLLVSSLMLVSCKSYKFQQWQIEDTMIAFQHQPPEKLFEKAKTSYQTKDYNSAIAEYNAFIKLHPTHKDAEWASMTLISCYLFNDQVEEAIQAVDEFIYRYPNSQHRKEVERIKYTLQIRLYNLRNIYHYDYTYLWTVLCLVLVNVLFAL